MKRALVLLLFFFPNLSFAKEAKLLCIPTGEMRDYNTETNRYVAEHVQLYIEDLIISINEKILTNHQDNGDLEFKRVRINADPNTFIMKFVYKLEDPTLIQYTFYRKSGRLYHQKRGGLYGIDENIRTDTSYRCSKYVGPVF